MMLTVQFNILQQQTQKMCSYNINNHLFKTVLTHSNTIWTTRSLSTVIALKCCNYVNRLTPNPRLQMQASQTLQLQGGSPHCISTNQNGLNLLHSWYSTKPKEKHVDSRFNFHGRNEKVAPLWARGVTLTIILGLVYYSLLDNEENKEIEDEITRYNEMNQKTPMGGEWILRDENGEEVNSREFLGQWMLIYFGFSHCPDICPEEMNKMKAVVEELDKKRKASEKGRKPMPTIQPIFITLDPDRDSPKVIKKYLEDFQIPRIKGFTGTLDEIKKVSKMFHVYFGFGEKDENDDYVVDHTIIIYLVNSEGKFVNYYSRALDAAPITASIERHIKLWDKISGPMSGTFYAKP